jgi:hypothetical protein
MPTITLDGGVRVHTFRPPADFNPLTASANDLVRHGFPQRPQDSRHLARYQRVFGQLQNKFTYIEPTLRVNTEKRHGVRARAARAGTETSTNWSGGVVFSPSGDPFHWVEGDWVVPNVDAPTQNQWYYCASWIGLDGDGSGDVCQAGVECEVYRSGSSITRNIYPWWEWYPIPEVQITNFGVSPGDMLTMLICTSGAGATSASLFITNRTTGLSTSMTFDAPSGTELIGNCAEWIVEAPTVGGSQSAMADYGEVFFSVCEAFTAKGATVTSGSGDNINMTAGSTTVSTATLVAPTVVQCEYTGSLPV